MITIRTTLRIDAEEEDKRIKDLIQQIKAAGFKTSHLKGVIQQRKLNG